MFKSFKYKGKRYILTEKDMMNKLPGMMITKCGVTVITINKKLDPVKKRAIIHRFITGRGLTSIVGNRANDMYKLRIGA